MDAMMIEKAQRTAAAVERALVNLRLTPPVKYAVKMRNGLTWLDCVFDVASLGRQVEAYERAAHTVGAAIGRPVYIANHIGLRYGVLLSPRPRLPERVEFPGLGETRDVFRLGVSLRGEVTVGAGQMVNALIGASQGAGKSNILHLMTYQMVAWGWQLYLADPQAHTFNPDLWNGRAAAPVAGGVEDMRRLLDLVEGALADRVAAFRALTQSEGIVPETIDAYNRLAESPMPRAALMVDEANHYLSDKTIMRRLADLARQARKFGIHIIIAGHDWRAADVPRELSAMLPTRIALSVADDTSGRVVLDSDQWGRWVIGKRPGRGVLKMSKYLPVQFYVAPEMRVLPEPVAALGETEREVARRALTETGGRITLEALQRWGLGHREARRLQETWRTRGWAQNDPQNGNALTITERLAGLAGFGRVGGLADGG